MMEPAPDETRARLLQKLRQLAPKRVRVLAGDDDARDIAVPERRRKWSQVIEAIEAQPWVRVELLDRAGLVLGYVENDGPAGDLEDVGMPAALGTPRMAEVRAMVEIMLRAQREALAQRNAEVSTILAGTSRLIEMFVGAFPAMLQMMAMRGDAAADIARMQAQAQAQDAAKEFDPLDLVKLMSDPDAMRGLMPLLMGLRQLTAPAAPTTPPPTPPPTAAPPAPPAAPTTPPPKPAPSTPAPRSKAKARRR